MEDGVKQVACRYAVVQFVPYLETGEFANVGVAMVCPQTGYFGFRLQHPRKSKRITGFFNELPRTVFARAVQGICTELQRIDELVARQQTTGRPEALREIFESLVHPREAIIRFSTPRVVLTDDPARELQDKFDHYVDRTVATLEYVEQEIERRIRALLGSLELKMPFRPARVGDDEVYVKFPLVQQRGTSVAKIIKPLNLNQTEPMGIYDHGGTWLQRIQRLRKRNLLPHDVLFAVRGPDQHDLKRFAAFEDICGELRLQDVLTVADDAQDLIANFATD
jgi:hypothetical protein